MCLICIQVHNNLHQLLITQLIIMLRSTNTIPSERERERAKRGSEQMRSTREQVQVRFLWRLNKFFVFESASKRIFRERSLGLGLGSIASVVCPPSGSTHRRSSPTDLGSPHTQPVKVCGYQFQWLCVQSIYVKFSENPTLK